MLKHKPWFMGIVCLALFFTFSNTLRASEADIKIPNLDTIAFQIGSSTVQGTHLLYGALVVCVLGMLFGLVQYQQTKNLPVHNSMRAVSNIIWETCKTYLWQQGRFL